MRSGVYLALTMLTALDFPAAIAQDVISTGKETVLEKHLAAEVPTVFVFLRADSTLEQAFLKELRDSAAKNVAFRVTRLKTGQEPIAKQHGIIQTPTAIVYDRRGRVVKRSSDPGEVREGVKAAGGVMRIDWALEGDPRLDEVVKTLQGRKQVPGILRTMSLQPEYMRYIHELSVKAHFSDGFLKRRTKELIATYVSALNKCKY